MTADNLAARFEAAEPNPLTAEEHEILWELSHLAVKQSVAETALRSHIQRATAAHIPWSVIATVLGTSQQDAQRRYGTF